MDKKYKIILGLLLIIIGFSIYMEANKPMPLNWTPNYTKKVSTPLGAKAINLYFEKQMHTNPQITEINQSTYEAFIRDKIEDKCSLLYFDDFVDLDEESLLALLDWVGNGNTVFLSSSYFPKMLRDTLNIELRRHLFEFQFNYKSNLKLTNPIFDETSYPSASEYDAMYFHKIDTASHLVLGHVHPIKNTEKEKAKEKDLVNFIKAPFGEGYFYLHTFPEAFGNHFFVHEDNFTYTTNILQYLNWNQPVYIDQYYKSGRETVDSLLFYVIQNRALKWAYYTAIVVSLIFVFVQGKRKQQPIPVQKELTNKTYEYTKTVANMFLEEKAHKAIAQKQIMQLMQYIRKQYLLSTREINQRFYKELAMKSAIDINDIKRLFQLIAYIEAQEEISKEKLMQLDEMISKIKQ